MPLLLTIATGSDAWRSEPHYSHIAGRRSRGDPGGPARPGRPYVLHATDEIVTEYAIDLYAADAPLHIVAIRTDRAKYALYTNWAPGPRRSRAASRRSSTTTDARGAPRAPQQRRAQPARGDDARAAGACARRGAARRAAAPADQRPRRRLSRLLHQRQARRPDRRGRAGTASRSCAAPPRSSERRQRTSSWRAHAAGARPRRRAIPAAPSRRPHPTLSPRRGEARPPARAPELLGPHQHDVERAAILQLRQRRSIEPPTQPMKR